MRQVNRVKKVYDDPKTPYQRVLDSPEVSAEAKRKLRAIHAKLDVVHLKERIDELMKTLTPTKQW